MSLDKAINLSIPTFRSYSYHVLVMTKTCDDKHDNPCPKWGGFNGLPYVLSCNPESFTKCRIYYSRGHLQMSVLLHLGFCFATDLACAVGGIL